MSRSWLLNYLQSLLLLTPFGDYIFNQILDLNLDEMWNM